MNRLIDLTGQHFGKLTVLEHHEWRGHETYWLCRCDCGTEKYVGRGHLIRGHTQSCGKCPNDYDLSGEFGIGYDCNGKKFYFDKDDYNKIQHFIWYIDSNESVVTYYVKSTGEKTKIQQHRLVMNCPENLVVDHINHIRHDNRKINLRICNYSQNGVYRINSKGYSFIKKINKYQARIVKDKKIIYLGYFNTEQEARQVYESAVKNYYGEDWLFCEDRTMPTPPKVR